MATTVKKTNAAAISRALSKAGFAKSGSSATRVRGYRYFSEGFEAINGKNAVIVKWEMGSSANYAKNWERLDERKGEAIVAMYEALTQAGYTVIQTNNGTLNVIKPITCDCGCGQAL